LFDFNLSNCPHRCSAGPPQEEEANLLASIWLAAAGLETLIRSQPALAEMCCLALAELKQKLGALIP
jgi:hypothetical protein